MTSPFEDDLVDHVVDLRSGRALQYDQPAGDHDGLDDQDDDRRRLAASDPAAIAALAARMRVVETEILARAPEFDITPSLDRIKALAGLLGDPETAYPVIHLTGTNGKTSTARMIDSLLRSAGLHTGRFTSPHLSSIRERITLDGEPVDEERFVRIYDEIASYAEIVDGNSAHRLSFFELLTGMAYATFADAPVDVAIIEVGMGGSWDSTNIADAQVAVISPIDLDHTRYLGDTVEQIATEKSGIIKGAAVAIVGTQTAEAFAPIAQRAVDVDATIAREGLEFGVASRTLAVGGQMLTLKGLGGTYEDIYLPLHGEHQAHNAACALAAVEAFFGAGTEERGPLDIDLVRDGFAKATSPGRLETVRTSPTVLLDAAHNPAGARATAAAVAEAFTLSRLIGVFAAFADKDVEGILEALEPVLADIVVTTNSSHRSMPVDELAAIAEDIFGEDRVSVAARLDEALDAAVALAEDSAEFAGGGVLVTGSIQTVAEARTLLTGA